MGHSIPAPDSRLAKHGRRPADALVELAVRDVHALKVHGDLPRRPTSPVTHPPRNIHSTIPVASTILVVPAVQEPTHAGERRTPFPGRRTGGPGRPRPRASRGTPHRAGWLVRGRGLPGTGPVRLARGETSSATRSATSDYSRSPGSNRLSRPNRSRQISAVHGSISDPQRLSRYSRSSGSARKIERPPHVRTARRQMSLACSITVCWVA